MDSTGRYSTASVKVKSIMNATNPVENITIMPNDVISVPKGDLVYAVGSINRPGGFLLGENETLTTLQVVSLAEGVSKTAASDKAKILRSVPGSTNREEIAVNIKQLMAGKASDIPLRANDILFIPNSGAKSASYRTLEAVIQTATGLAVYGR
jgi:polysaccharide export outer membrane protein